VDKERKKTIRFILRGSNGRLFEAQQSWMGLLMYEDIARQAEDIFCWRDPYAVNKFDGGIRRGILRGRGQYVLSQLYELPIGAV